MDRRALLLQIGPLLLPGCIASDSEDTPPGSERTQNDDSDDALDGEYGTTSGGLRIVEVYPREVERADADYEFVRLENDRDEPLNVSGYVLDYGNGTRYEFGELELEAGAMVTLMTRGGSDTVLETSPPIYHRFAGFDGGQNASVMDGTGTVRLLDPNGTGVDELEYDVDDPPPQREPNV